MVHQEVLMSVRIASLIYCSAFAVIFTSVASRAAKGGTINLGAITPTHKTQIFENSSEVLTGDSVVDTWSFSLTGGKAVITAQVGGPMPSAPFEFGVTLYDSAGDVLAEGVDCNVSNSSSFDECGGGPPGSDPILGPGSYELTFDAATDLYAIPGQLNPYMEIVSIKGIGILPTPEPTTLPLLITFVVSVAGIKWRRGSHNSI
jgi:hypothetical protein